MMEDFSIKTLITNKKKFKYVEQGEGPLVLLVHGWPETLVSWRHQISFISKLGFKVVALTGKKDQADYLESLGASSVIMRSEMEEQGKPLQKGIYQGGVDTVGGNILSNFISQTSQRGAITCCGNVASDKLQTSVFPFILRGVTLIGIDSAESILEVKKEIWNNFSNDWKIDLEKITKEVQLESLSEEVDKILKGEQIGRIRVNLG